MIGCFFGCHKWSRLWMRVDDAVRAGLPHEAVVDRKGRVYIQCCYKCGKIVLSKEAPPVKIVSCNKCGHDMLFKKSTQGMPPHYVCLRCAHTMPASTLEGNEGRRHSGKRTLVD